MSNNPYQQFEELRSELLALRRLGEIQNLLSWDQSTYMPAGAAKDRTEQIAVLAEMKHERLIADSLYEKVLRLSESENLDELRKSILRELKRDLTRARVLPPSLVKALGEVESLTHSMWLKARNENNFSVVIPSLEEQVRLKREYAKTLEPTADAYDTLVDSFDRGLNSNQIEKLFTPVKNEVIRLLAEFKGKTKRAVHAEVPVPLPQQEKIFQTVATAMGFDFHRGRLDATVHPFASDHGRNDLRLTTYYKETDILHGLQALMHETGHGLYDQGLREDFWGTPLSDACSIGIHESQSLLWERIVGFSPEFSEYFIGELRRELPATYSKWDAREIWLHLNQLDPSLNRLESDELHYVLHIILRSQLESQVIRGTLQIRDLPAAWNEKCVEAFGRAPEDDLRGVLQDIHWFIGVWGYFPSYLMGAIYSAQLFETFLKKHSSAPAEFRTGNFTSIHKWLKRNIYSVGRIFTPSEVIEQVTGSPTSSQALLNRFRQKLELLSA